MKKVFLSFAGTNDAGTLTSEREGAIVTALLAEKYDEAVIFWNENDKAVPNFKEITDHLADLFRKRNLIESYRFVQVNIPDITDHNGIYDMLKGETDKLPKHRDIGYTASITSGTPAMQVCWILLAESGDFSEEFPLRLIRVIDPRFTEKPLREVKLSTTLPKIISMKQELNELKDNLIPEAKLLISKGLLKIGSAEVPLSPVEFAYYRYFCERKLNDEEEEKFSGLTVSDAFTRSIIEFHEVSFPDLDLNRLELIQILKSGAGLSITTFRGNISKINKKIETALNNSYMAGLFKIESAGKRGAKFYGIRADQSKIRIVR